MHKLKQLTACLLAVLLVFSATASTVLAAGEPTIRVSEADANQGETVDVTVSLENNPGIINLKLNVSYDSDALTLTKVADAGIFGTAYHAPVNQENPAGNPYILSWANDTATENLKVNGTLVTLTFAVDENAYGRQDIKVTYGNDYIYDVDLKPVAFTIVNGAVTVEAGVPVSYTVTFNANGGTGTMNPQTANVPTALTTNTFTRTGYTFVSWNTAADGTGTSFADKAVYGFSADIKLYAQWTALPTHTVTFDANGGTGTMSPQTANVPTALTENTFEKTDYIFAGWNTAADGNGMSYADKAVYDFTDDITLYAQWTTLLTHTVTFEANGGTGTMSPQTASAATALTANAFTQTDYIFAGWNTAADGNGMSYADKAVYDFTEDITLYAQWTALPTLRGDVNGDGLIDTDDAVIILRFDALLDVSRYASFLINDIADLNGDDLIDSDDAVLIKQYDVGLISVFPVDAN